MKSPTTVLIPLFLADALSVGLTMCATARAGKIHASAIEVYERVGRALIKAAQEPVSGEVES